MRVLLLDNIDSFTYNIYHYLEALGAELTVKDNRQVTRNDVDACDSLVISPGPGLPATSGKLMEMLGYAVSLEKPILGVCLGMQAIAEYFGGTLYNQQEVKHGQPAKLLQEPNGGLLFRKLPGSFQIGLYHSWAVHEPLPDILRATAFSEEGVMMALEHCNLPVYGVQFHPESILSQYGKEVFANFLFHS